MRKAAAAWTFGILLVMTCHGQTAHYRKDGGYALPDAKVTPGVVDPACVADPSGKPHKVGGLEENICAADFRTGPIRATIVNFAKLKREACAEYGVSKCDASVEGDHLISIEICGKPDDLRNIWPQPMDQARVKDHRAEDVLPKLICSGKISLSAAQKGMAADWYQLSQSLPQKASR